MTAPEFEARIITWARQQPDLQALVLAGSRAREEGKADVWSDWDFHLITSRPQRYQQTGWLEKIAPCWCAHAERTPRGVIKVSAVFEQGFEADFVPLAAWQMKLVYAGMRHPGWAHWMPRRLRRGIQETRGFMLGSGHRLLVGGADWARRFTALQVAWPETGLTVEEFADHTAAFWQKAVWVFKKIARPEPRSAMHWLHLLVVHQVYPLLAEEARLAGRPPRPEARKAEQWLDDARLRQTAIMTGPEPQVLARALLAELTLFREVAQSVAARRGFTLPDYSAVEAWLRAELAKVSGG
jgi:aminoglycoside 6-adenylyltransferase